MRIPRAIYLQGSSAIGSIAGGNGATRTAIRDGVCGSCVCARDQLRKLYKVPAVKRQVDDLLAVDNSADGRVFCLQQGSSGACLDGHCFVHLSNRYLEILSR